MTIEAFEMLLLEGQRAGLAQNTGITRDQRKRANAIF